MTRQEHLEDLRKSLREGIALALDKMVREKDLSKTYFIDIENGNCAVLAWENGFDDSVVENSETGYKWYLPEISLREANSSYFMDDWIMLSPDAFDSIESFDDVDDVTNHLISEYAKYLECDDVRYDIIDALYDNNIDSMDITYDSKKYTVWLSDGDLHITDMKTADDVTYTLPKEKLVGVLDEMKKRF